MSRDSAHAMRHSFYDITPLVPLIEQGRTLLTPNNRLARRLVDEWNHYQLSLGNTVWETLPVSALERWLLNRWREAVALGLAESRCLLSPIQEMQLWRKVIESSPERGDIRPIINPAGAAELASKARTSLIDALVPLESESVRQRFESDTDCAAFLLWNERFETELTAAGLCTAADCRAAVYLNAADLPAASVALVSFEDLAPLAQQALASLCDDLPNAPDAGELAQRRMVAFPEKRAELRTVAAWAAEIHRDAPQSTIGIVIEGDMAHRLALEHLLRREFDCLGENYNALPVNFSSGLQLAQVPMVRDALLALSFTGRSVDTLDVVAALHSRYLDTGDVHATSTQLFVRRLYDEGAVTWTLSDLRYFADRHASSDGASVGFALHERLAAIAAAQWLRGKKLPSEWAMQLHAVLDMFGWPGTQSLDSLEYQQLQDWYDVLDSLRQMDVIEGSVDLTRAITLVRLLCDQTVAQPLTQDSTIQVLGPLEAAGLQFDFLWLTGMQASTWPGAAKPNPFIPHSIQAHYALPRATPESEQGFAQALLMRFCHSARKLTASYCKQLDGAPELPSAMLTEFSPVELSVPGAFPTAWGNQLRTEAFEHLSDHQAPALNTETSKGGSRLLEDQSHCPFRAFANWRLRVQALPDFGIGLSPAARGSLLHDALQMLWTALQSHAALAAADAAHIESALQSAVGHAIDVARKRRRSGLGAVYWELEAERTRGVLHEWLIIEKARAPFVVKSMEQKFNLQIGDLEVRLRIDRIDELTDGSLAIIDYKTGKGSVAQWLGERPAKPQLLLYGLAVPELAGALAFGQVRGGECRYVGIGSAEGIVGVSNDFDALLARAGEEPATWEELNARWQSRLVRLANDYLQGSAAVDPLGEPSCRWCGLQPLCRVDRDSGALADIHRGQAAKVSELDTSTMHAKSTRGADS